MALRARCVAFTLALLLLALVRPGALRAAGAQAEDATPPNARKIVERAFANLYGFHSVQRLELRSRQASGQEFTRTAQITRHGSVGQEPNRMMVRLLGPGPLRGIGLLLLEQPSFEYDAFLYQPLHARVRRISMAQRKDPFFGTDFVFEDLEAKRASQWAVRLVGAKPHKGRRAWVVELRPESLPSGYERVVGWFDQELPVMLYAEFYRDGKRLKELEIAPERVRAIGGFHVPHRVEVRGAKGSSTVLEVLEVEIRDELPASTFTRTALEFGDAARAARPN